MKTLSSKLIIIIMFFFFLGGFSFVISVAAVPSTRALSQIREAESSMIPHTYLLHQENNNQGIGELRRRMDIETNDYPDPGANRDHDPPVSGGSTP